MMGIGRMPGLGILAMSLTLTAGVGAQATVSAGGQVRQQYERFANEEWSAETPDANGYWLQRYMFHLDARISRRLRVYGELKSGIEVGRAGGPRPPDEDHLDVHQIFVDVSVGPVAARVGRQEFAFGSQRLVSVRERPNVRQTFDGASVVLLWRPSLRRGPSGTPASVPGR